MASIWRSMAAGCLLVLTQAVDVSGQQGSGSAIPVQGLRFGTLTPGMVAQVSVNDNQGRAAIEVTGRGQVTVSFGLPGGLNGSDGGLLPLQFGALDGRVLIAGHSQTHSFDPRVPFSFALTGSQGQASIFLGGSATPAASQKPGTYTAEITVTVTISSGTT